jgi:hypothetical protein
MFRFLIQRLGCNGSSPTAQLRRQPANTARRFRSEAELLEDRLVPSAIDGRAAPEMTIVQASAGFATTAPLSVFVQIGGGFVTVPDVVVSIPMPSPPGLAVALAGQQNDPIIEPANFISTPQLLTLKLPRNFQTITGQAPLIQDVASKGQADEPAPNDSLQQFIDAICDCSREVSNPVWRERVHSTDAPLRGAGALVALDPSRAHVFDLGEATRLPAEGITPPRADEASLDRAAGQVNDGAQKPATPAVLTSLSTNDWSRQTALDWFFVVAGMLLAAERSVETDDADMSSRSVSLGSRRTGWRGAFLAGR